MAKVAVVLTIRLDLATGHLKSKIFYVFFAKYKSSFLLLGDPVGGELRGKISFFAFILFEFFSATLAVHREVCKVCLLCGLLFLLFFLCVT